MPSPYQYPWVNFGSVLIQNVDSTELLLYTAPAATIIDSIIITNLTEKDIFIDFKILGERIPPLGDSPVAQKPFLAKRRLVEKSSGIEILPTPQSIVILEAGDFVYANSDSSRNTFDCIISYRQLLETSI